MNYILIPLPLLAKQTAIMEGMEVVMTTRWALGEKIEQSRTHAALKEGFAPTCTRVRTMIDFIVPTIKNISIQFL
jgi:hypothetical protein